MKQTILKILLWLRDVCIKAMIIVLIAVSFNKPIEVHLLTPLWNFLQIEYSRSLVTLVVLLSVIIGIHGWRMYKCRYDEKHIGLYVMAWALYVFYSKQWNYVDFGFGFNCWETLLLSFPVGFCVHWLYYYTYYILKHKEKQDVKSGISVEVPSVTLIDDNPVQDISDDEFRYGHFAQRIARTITERTGRSSFSLGITGIWGAGKTSMLNLLKRYVEKDNSCIVVDFNPRKSSEVKFIQHDFLTTICSALRKYHTGATHIISDYMKGLSVLAKDTSWTKILDVIHSQDVKSSREDVENMIRAIGRQIVVIIDDFDRLTGEEIVEVLKVIGNNGSFERTFFVSAYDKGYVNQVLKAYFHETVDRDYTDKYFNLELRLPDRKLFYKNGYLQRQMYALQANGTIANMSQWQIDEALISVVSFIDSYLPTPRDIKRYIGLVIASFADIQESVVLKDFLLLGLIKYKYPEEYDLLYKHVYFKQNPFGGSSDTNFVLKDARELVDIKSFAVLRILFPSSGQHEVTDRQFGYKHLSWKRSFDFYFFDQELGHIPFKDLITLAAPDISTESFRKAVQHWNSEDLKKDVADFVMSRSAMVHTAYDFKDYLRLSVMARYFCRTHQIYIHCIHLLVKSNLEENAKEFGISTNEYLKIVDEFIGKGSEWVLSAILLQDALYLCLKSGEELDLIFSHIYLQSVAEKILRHVINTFHAERATTEDVYETLKANIIGVTGDGGFELSEKALLGVKEDMVKNAKLYFKDIVWHQPVQGRKTGLVLGFNNHLPITDLFKTQDDFAGFLREVDKADNSLKGVTSCLFEIYNRIGINHFKPFVIDTKESNQNISQCDFHTYNLIFEGER